MFYKAIMTSLTVSIFSTSLLVPSQALADSASSSIQRDANGTVDHRRQTRDHRNTDATQVRDHRTKTTVRDHRTKTTVRDHRTQRESETVPVVEPKKDCRVGATKLFKMGYRSIHAVDCSGTTYHYIAVDKAALFAAKMNAYSGEINVTFIGIAG